MLGIYIILEFIVKKVNSSGLSQVDVICFMIKIMIQFVLIFYIKS